MSADEATRTVRAAERARRMRSLGVRLGLPVAAALGAGAGLAAGAIPGSDHVIHGCFLSAPPIGAQERYGQLRVIDPDHPVTLPTGGPDTTSDRCLSDESAISWNEQGPTGPQGPPGPSGSQGANGADGSVLVGNTSFGLSGSGSEFLKLDGIKGEANVKGHKDEIELSAFAIGAANVGSGSSSGLSKGKVSFNSFSITKKVDKASPALFAAVTSGKHITSGEVAFTKKIGGKPVDYLTFKFTGLLVSSVKLAGQGNAPTEQVTLSFQKLSETFQGYDAKGKKVAPVTVQVNVNNSAKS